MIAVNPEHVQIIDALTTASADHACETTGLVPPDVETLRIIWECVGMGFEVGVAYGQTDPALPAQVRLQQAIALHRAGRVT